MSPDTSLLCYVFCFSRSRCHFVCMQCLVLVGCAVAILTACSPLQGSDARGLHGVVSLLVFVILGSSTAHTMGAPLPVQPGQSVRLVQKNIKNGRRAASPLAGPWVLAPRCRGPRRCAGIRATPCCFAAGCVVTRAVAESRRALLIFVAGYVVARVFAQRRRARRSSM